MKGRTFIILLVLAGVMAVGALFTIKGKKETGQMGNPLFKDLPVNEIAAVQIISADNTVTMVKGKTEWQVKERFEFPADFGRLSDLILKIDKLKIGRRFEASSKTLKRLKLMPPDSKDSAKEDMGVKILLKDKDDKEIESIILGNERESETGAGGQYLLVKGGNTVCLVDGSFKFLKKGPVDWLGKDILDVKADTIESVTAIDGSGRPPIYTLKRPGKSKTAEMAAIPEGRTSSSSKIDQVFEALGPLTLSDVSPRSNKKALQMRLEYQLYDGTKINVYPVESKDSAHPYQVKITAVFNPDYKKPADDQGVKEAATGTTKSLEAVKKEAENLNARVSPWTFFIEKWQYESLITTVEGLLEEKIDKKKAGASDKPAT